MINHNSALSRTINTCQSLFLMNADTSYAISMPPHIAHKCRGSFLIRKRFNGREGSESTRQGDSIQAVEIRPIRVINRLAFLLKTE